MAEDFLTANEQRAMTVTELNNLVHDVLEGCDVFSRIAVRGEISNFVHHRSGHLYFSLKDEGGLVRAVMFRSAASRLAFVPENGMKVIVMASLTTYVKDGQYQLMVTSMEPDGVGALFLAFERLKKKLAAEGLFDEVRKKPLPKIPTHIGIITSPTGAALRDMLNILKRRFPLAQVLLYPALVQGSGAPASLVKAITVMGSREDLDLLIIGRGGGSAEDLWCFNDESLARAIAACPLPVISAVGHETDFTICDLVSDLRAPTPSAAAELAVPETDVLLRRFRNVVDRMALLCERSVKKGKERLHALSSRRIFTDPDVLYRAERQRLDACFTALSHAADKLLYTKRARLEEEAAKLNAMSPLAILSRGYAVPIKDGTTVKSVAELPTDTAFSLRMADGTLHARVVGREE